MRARRIAAFVLAALFAAGGVLHFVATDAFAQIVPPPLPGRPVVLLTGVLELIFAAGLTAPRTRRITGQLLSLYCLAVLPANIYMALEEIPIAGISLPASVLWLRVALQLPLIALILWATRPPTPR